MTDRELLDKMINNDCMAFEMLYNRYERLFYQWCFSRLNDPDTTAEVVQNFWIDVWKYPKEIKPNNQGSAKNYLLKGLTFRILKHIQREMNRLEIPDEALIEQQIPDLSYTHVSEDLYVKEILEILDTIVQNLPPLTRQIYQLQYIENLSVEETAKRLSINEKTVRNRLSSAIATIRQELPLAYDISGAGKLKTLLPFLLLFLDK